ncbi:hypothetical protein [Staphylococcus edaphicus]|uniref:Uncharacterized protein n=1 Tax=Staphylococcus edaphicus TaxID=1955013 RepID=A0A2C6U914_9STAP|nr:hypothetical protein [Staphylococcus edaphicus]PHK50282.1 hypothetical protein BTJ66_04215 [Staphylococcus edaphicus]UQW82121.1 hypothetical protein MNY58_03180 [Staphylococcus edaphicus]
MNHYLLKRTLTISIIFGVLFFIINYFSGSDSSIVQQILKSVLVIIVFGILYYALFSIVNSPERKYKFGITIPIALLITILISAIFSAMKAGIVIGLILGIAAGYVWEFIAKNKNGGDSH